MKRVEIFDRTKDSKSCVEVMDDLLHCVWCKMLAPCLTLSKTWRGVIRALNPCSAHNQYKYYNQAMVWTRRWIFFILWPSWRLTVCLNVCKQISMKRKSHKIRNKVHLLVHTLVIRTVKLLHTLSLGVQGAIPRSASPMCSLVHAAPPGLYWGKFEVASGSGDPAN